jgi:hypothetical protein
MVSGQVVRRDKKGSWCGVMPLAITPPRPWYEAALRPGPVGKSVGCVGACGIGRAGPPRPGRECRPMTGAAYIQSSVAILTESFVGGRCRVTSWRKAMAARRSRRRESVRWASVTVSEAPANK